MSVQEVVQFFDEVNTQEEVVRKQLTFEDFYTAYSQKKVRVNTKTPAKREHENLLDHYEQLHGESLEGTLLSQDAIAVLDKVRVFNQFLAMQMNDGQTIGNITSEKVEALKLEIRSWPTHTKASNPISLWIGIAKLQDEVFALTKRHEEAVAQATKCAQNLARDDKWRDSMRAVSNSLSTDITNLQNNVRSAIEAVGQQIAAVKGSVWSEFQSVSNLCEANDIASLHDVEIRDLKDKLDRMQTQVQTMIDGKQAGGSLSAVTVGCHTFHLVKELEAWCEAMFKKEPIPFGPFACPYGAYARCLSSNEGTELTGLQIMDRRKSPSLSPDKSLVLECIQHKLPKLFIGSSAEHKTIYAHLPALNTRDKWEDKHRMKGIRVTIRDNKESVRSRYSSLISQRLSKFHEAQGIAKELLSNTMDFIESVNTFINDTDSRLVNAGFNPDLSWDLVTKLAHRVFAVDCHDVRDQVKEFLDPSQHKIMALGCLWGTFATHMVMKQYSKHGLENHPSIAAEYVRFLVANSGLGRLEKVEKRVLKLEDGMNATVKRLDALKKVVADSALTKANEAYSLAKKK